LEEAKELICTVIISIHATTKMEEGATMDGDNAPFGTSKKLFIH
jgi:hypothetical protein